MQSDESDSETPMTHFVQTQSFSSSDTKGKHRIHAELKRLEQETRYLEEELEKLERMDKASASCKEMLSNVEKRPDPLLPFWSLKSYMGSMVRRPSRFQKLLQMLDSLMIKDNCQSSILFSFTILTPDWSRNFVSLIFHE
ncbi:uncharacterized protein LOC131617608 isoform X1 [Vicia villosa]|uniref:uncharacterized protein LOC131617608 isoform X1 n=1 Tax=Vicia villosa TaxID=3911 RepID=UPI00273A9CB2|nr:uncharacterized protein LOC131617608 isoform X1 [Vicia villosa]